MIKLDVLIEVSEGVVISSTLVIDDSVDIVVVILSEIIVVTSVVVIKNADVEVIVMVVSSNSDVVNRVSDDPVTYSEFVDEFSENVVEISEAIVTDSDAVVRLSDVAIDSSIVLLVIDSDVVERISDDIVDNSDVVMVTCAVDVSNRQVYRIIFTILFWFKCIHTEPQRYLLLICLHRTTRILPKCITSTIPILHPIIKSSQAITNFLLIFKNTFDSNYIIRLKNICSIFSDKNEN